MREGEGEGGEKGRTEEQDKRGEEARPEREGRGKNQRTIFPRGHEKYAFGIYLDSVGFLQNDSQAS